VVTFEEDKKTMANRSGILSTGIVLLLLVGLPAMSYWYLATGYEYRKDGIMTQGDFGKMPDLQTLSPVRGELPGSLRGSMTVVGWLDPTKNATTEAYGQMLDSVYQQFKDSPYLYFTTIIQAGDPAAAASSFAEKHSLDNSDMLSFLAADEAAFLQTARDFKLPGIPGESPVVALVDSSLTIVKHYDLSSREETLGLVQLISLIIPLPQRPEIVLEREKEL